MNISFLAQKNRLWATLFSLALGLAGTIWFAVIQMKEEDQALRYTILNTAQFISSEIFALLEKDFKALERMADRRRVMPEMAKEIWQQDARNYVEDLEAIDAVGWADRNFRSRWVEPLAGHEKIPGVNLMFEERRAATLTRALEQNKPYVSPSIELVGGGVGFTIYIPIGAGEHFNGLIVGAFKFEDLLTISTIQGIEQDFDIVFVEGDVPLAYAANRAVENPHLTFYAPVEIMDLDWKIGVSPTNGFLQRGASRLPLITFIGGMGLTLLLVGLVNLAFSLSEQVRRAEAANEANLEKSRFLASISHDLRTPLNAILGFSEVMTGHMFGPLGSEKYDEYATDIKKSGEYLLSLINDLLDISAIEAGEREISKTAINLTDIVAEYRTIISEKLNEKSIRFTAEIPEDLPPVYGDSRAVTQILVNLLANAVKFTPPNGSICLRGSLAGNEHRIDVIDTGIGISNDKIKKVVEPFFTGSEDPYHRKEGTGLGLTIVKSLMELHGGRMEIASKVNEGTSVSLYFPFEQSVGN